MKSRKRILAEILTIIAITLLIINYTDLFLEKNTAELRNEVVHTDQGNQYKEYLPEKSYKGLTLIPEAGTEKVLLTDMLGKVVKSWNIDAPRARLLRNCDLLTLHGTKWGIKQKKWKSLRNKIRVYHFNGDLKWEYKAKNIVHHDIKKQENGNLVFLERTTVPEKYVLKSRDPNRQKIKIRTDIVKEINSQGKKVWEWSYFNAFSIDYCGKNPCPKLDKNYVKGGKLYDWTHTNTVSPLPKNKWYDSGDQRFKPGNLLILPRNWSTVFLIDKESKKIVWKYTGKYKGGLSGGHEVHMIEKGLEGAGNILIFDNGRNEENLNGSSYILEVNPITKKEEWVYDVGNDFFSYAAGSMQRLPNGNTLISEDVKGRVFEITPEKQIVWQFKSNVRTCRAKRYSFDYCKDLEKFR